MSTLPPPPTPFQIIRTHSAPLSCVAFNPSNTLLYSGDQDGWVSVTDLRVRRSVLFWKAHDGGVTTVEEWNSRLVSHGRDNLLHIYEPLPLFRQPTARTSASTAPSHHLQGKGNDTGKTPAIWKSLPVNALNFCRFSLLPIPATMRETLRDDVDVSLSADAGGSGNGGSEEALLAVPNMVDSELADVYHLPSMKRLHAALNTPSPASTSFRGKGKGKEQATETVTTSGTRSGLIMSMHLRRFPDGIAATEMASEPDSLRGKTPYAGSVGLIIGYEDGRVDVWVCPGPSSGVGAMSRWRQFSDGSGKVGARVWELAYSGKGHNEAVMAMAVSSDGLIAYTASADHLLVKYDLRVAMSNPSSSKIVSSTSLKQIGNASLAISGNDRILAIGGWNGKIRLLSAQSLKPLGTLAYHRESIQCLAFAKSSRPLDEQELGGMPDDSSETGERVPSSTIELCQDDGSDDDDDTDRDDQVGGAPPSRWLASGGKDRRIGLWGLMDFDSGRPT